MDLHQFISREIALANSDKLPDPLSLRFGELQAKLQRSADEDKAYRHLLAIMTSRWRWFQASCEARRKSGAKTISTAPAPD